MSTVPEKKKKNWAFVGSNVPRVLFPPPQNPSVVFSVVVHRRPPSVGYEGRLPESLS